jgi:cystathionine beta-lyase
MVTTRETAVFGAAAGLAFGLLALARRRRRDMAVDRSADSLYTVKYGRAPAVFGEEAVSAGALPLWVADMELACPAHVCEALARRCEHRTFGYTYQPELIWQRVRTWMVQRQGWTRPPPPEAFVFSASVVTSFANVLEALTEPGDGVLVMTPLYAPLQDAVRGTGRRLERLSLSPGASGHLELDVPSRLEPLLAAGRIRLLLLCNPHNPTGRVWSRAELGALAAACARHGVLVASDEIWSDWALWRGGGGGGAETGAAHSSRQYVPFAEAARAAGCAHVTMGAPTKTFNLAGLHCSYVVLEDEGLRERYMRRITPAVLHYGSTFATTAMLAAYVGKVLPCSSARARLL